MRYKVGVLVFVPCLAVSWSAACVCCVPVQCVHRRHGSPALLTQLPWPHRSRPHRHHIHAGHPAALHCARGHVSAIHQAGELGADGPGSGGLAHFPQRHVLVRIMQCVQDCGKGVQVTFSEPDCGLYINGSQDKPSVFHVWPSSNKHMHIQVAVGRLHAASLPVSAQLGHLMTRGILSDPHLEMRTTYL